jgi:hypothetical protein
VKESTHTGRLWNGGGSGQALRARRRVRFPPLTGQRAMLMSYALYFLINFK